jgi:hypothetical protein
VVVRVKRLAEVRPTDDGRWQVTLAGLLATVVERESEVASLIPAGWPVQVQPAP